MENKFKIGQRLEAIDRKYPTYCCVAFVKDVRGDQILISFDGWGDGYDYWCSINTPEIAPIGTCDEKDFVLQPPHGRVGTFDWETYLNEIQQEAAPKENFPHPEPLRGQRVLIKKKTPELGGKYDGPINFKVGQRLEALDRQHGSNIYVAHVAEINEKKQLKIQLDGYQSQYWCYPDSNEIGPVGTCKNKRYVLLIPPGIESDTFKWEDYLKSINAEAAPEENFPNKNYFSGFNVSREAEPNITSGEPKDIQFKIGDRLEAIDRKYPTLVCVARIKDISPWEVLISFDGWTAYYDYWCDPASPEIAPCGTSEQSGRQLQPPKNYGKPFNWDTYLSEINARAAPTSAFVNFTGGLGEFNWSSKLAEKLEKPEDPPSYSESQRKDIFLSYGRESSVSSWVTKLKSDLEESGFTVFLADSHPTNSNGNWFMEIGTAVVECQALIAIITYKYSESEFCRNELFMAKQEGKFIFPCFYEDLPALRPDMKYAIGSVNWTRFDGQGGHGGRNGDGYQNSLNRLIQGLIEMGVPSTRRDELLKPPPIEKKDQVEIPIPNQMQMSHLPQTLEEKQLLLLQRMEVVVARLERRNNSCCSIS